MEMPPEKLPPPRQCPAYQVVKRLLDLTRRRSCGRLHHSELHHHVHHVEVLTLAVDFPIADLDYVAYGTLHPLAGGGDAHELALVGAAVGHLADSGISLDVHPVELQAGVRERAGVHLGDANAHVGSASHLLAVTSRIAVLRVEQTPDLLEVAPIERIGKLAVNVRRRRHWR